MPKALRSWEMGCTQFFIHKDVSEKEKVKKVAWGMQDPQIQDWYITNQERIDLMTFREYMAEVHTVWLPIGWADTVQRKMLASMQGQRAFSEWAIDMQSQNTLLRGTTSHLADINILYHLESHMNIDLAADYHAENIVEEDLRKWIEKVRILDEKRLRYLARQKEAVDTALCNECARTTNDKKGNSNNKSTAKGGNTQLKDGHTSSNCPKGFPDGATYKTLTASAVLGKKTKKKEVVAVVYVDEEVETVMVVMPSAVLGNGTDPGKECVAPLQTPHLHWDCLVDGPAVSSPLTLSALIDHGSSLVLIGEDLVNKLGLRRHQLRKPVPVSLALSKDKESFLLSQYVKLSCTSLDQVYMSQTPKNATQPSPPHISPSGPQLFWMKRDVINELKAVLPELKDIVDNECEQVNGTDVIAAIQSRIDGLLYQEQLRALDDKYKKVFEDRFPADIPHNDTMPSDVLFWVSLKDANKIVQLRSYNCLKKYWAAWKTLLDSHVDSGRL
ncbi:hypothetical protein BDR05DRAFT_1002179 [Suillus weaverae]|nr:hypothetical protein BDR05DRAFT_1002179 [Suillus weaverae]